MDYMTAVNLVVEELYEMILSGGGDADTIRQKAEDICDIFFEEIEDET